jgi:hypothetical protein
MADTFIKMHGLGNDFVIIDARDTAVAMTAARAHAIADRRRGIGCDQLILLEPSASADLSTRMGERWRHAATPPAASRPCSAIPRVSKRGAAC